jgi:hypothetical protein
MALSVISLQSSASVAFGGKQTSTGWQNRPVRSRMTLRRLAATPSGISARRSQQFNELSYEPSPTVDIELHQAFVSHFQQEGLASFFIHDIGAFHDLAHF